MTANEPDIQNNCSMCPPFTRTSELLPSVCHATDQWICWWSVGQDSPSRCALCPWDRPGWKLDTCSSAKLPRQHSQPDLSPGCWVAIQTVRRNSARYAAGTWQLISLDETARRPVETRNAAEFRRSNLHLPWFLCRTVDKVYWLWILRRTPSRIHAFVEVLAALDQTIFRKRSLTELTAHFFCHPSIFLPKNFNQTVFFEREQHSS